MMMGPFISSLQISISPMMSLNLYKDQDLDLAGKALYAVSNADIMPDLLLIPAREGIYGEFDEDDETFPEWYTVLGYDTRNFIVCTGSVLIFLQA